MWTDAWLMPSIKVAEDYVRDYEAASPNLKAHYDKACPDRYRDSVDFLIWSGHREGTPSRALTPLVQEAAVRWKKGNT